MAWIYFPALVESDSHSNHGSEPSPIVSVTDTLKASFCPGCDQVKLIPLQSGTMSQPCAERCSHGLTLSSEDSPVRISASQDVERAWTESEAVFSSRSPDLQENANLDLFSSKTSLPSEPVEVKEWSKNWPRSGMTVAGLLSQPPQLEPSIEEKDGFYWPTPTNRDHKGGFQYGRIRYGKPSTETLDQTVQAYRPGGLLNPDPTAVKTFGQLNPQWVEWLMGYEIGHTELDASVTAWFRSKSERRSKSSQG